MSCGNFFLTTRCRHCPITTRCQSDQQRVVNKLCGRPPQCAPPLASCPLTFFDLESDVRVTCDVGYLCANFSLPIGLSDVRDRQTSDVHHRLMPPTLGAGHNKSAIHWSLWQHVVSVVTCHLIGECLQRVAVYY